jgi:hypothetical protein
MNWKLPSIYVLINLLFIVKYSLRIHIAASIVASLLYILLCGVMFYFIYKKQSDVGNKTLLLLFISACVALIGMQMSIDPYDIKVDRWSAIHNFLVRFFRGDYPYMAQTHLGGYGSPFPVWQIMHIPFFLLGNVGLSVFVGFGLFVYAIRAYADNVVAFRSMVLLLVSPAFLYEVTVRSDMITIFLLVSAIVLLLYNYRVKLRTHFWSIAIGCGLLMSTRLTAIIPLAFLYLVEWWKMGNLRKIIFPMIVILLFVITFLPFVFWSLDDLFFFQYNPFVLQSRQIHSMDFLLFIPLFLYLAIVWTQERDDKKRFYHLTTNITIFLLSIVAVTFTHNMVLSGNFNLFSPAFDITYFNMSLPFLIAGLSINSR